MAERRARYSTRGLGLLLYKGTEGFLSGRASTGGAIA